MDNTRDDVIKIPKVNSFPVLVIAALSCVSAVSFPSSAAAFSFTPTHRMQCVSRLNKRSSLPTNLDQSRMWQSMQHHYSYETLLRMNVDPIREQTDLPANLKRRVNAKRPTLGHVVPKTSRTRRHNPSDNKGGSNSALLRPQGEGRDTDRYNNPSNLRILGGTHRGRKLESPDVYLRPMMGKVKEAVFSTFTSFGLYDDVGGVACKTRHLDIFSGSGSVGLESLSRGARHCTFVDMSNDCCGTCQRNVERCGFDGWNEGGLGSGIGEEGEPVAKVVCADAFRALRQPETVGIDPNCKYDLVTLCPPYEEIVYADLLEAVANSELVKEDTIILIEYPVELGCLPHVIRQESGGVLIGVRNRKYGRTVIGMYIVNPTGALESAESRPEEFIKL
ncbi:hypothetical protein HJC23_008419 [Cyclotella cryptica]|uniref:Uncharacterized protein n=1 Tax=Cyclotella cryptica TaxID=29204 RepID=A0ABD3PXG6_9STRA|eukprot:CCRYP_010707-RA/>CCRYP_010707-RA protein AED:0.04 eAED:0.04 QI:275/1/1/1/0.5/0.33/3/599/390